MVLKRKIAAVLAALTVTSAVSVVAYAEGQNFSLTATKVSPDVTTRYGAPKKEDNSFAAVTPRTGIPSFVFVTFNVRAAEDGADVSEMVDAYALGVPVRVDYLPNKGIPNHEYCLAARLGQKEPVSSVDVTGYWVP